MPRSLFLIFNHEITSVQKSDARNSLGVQQIINMPPDLKDLWRQIPPDLTEISNYLEPIKTWLARQAVESDYVLIQGDFGACFIMVNFAFKIDLIPIYSTTEREAVEEHKEDGTVNLSHQFRHRIFRRYEE
ncbi:MAG: CRISPR-associated protein Csx20 [Deltaproteobacteria bacterium]|nr:CRISPR-associated protein Csx20 [Deltaproteobacteria bacterium]